MSLQKVRVLKKAKRSKRGGQRVGRELGGRVRESGNRKGKREEGVKDREEGRGTREKENIK